MMILLVGEFFDSSTASLQALLLHNGVAMPSATLVHAVKLKETFGTVELLLL